MLRKPAGEEFGALQLRSFADLYGDQRKAVTDIIAQVHSIAAEAFLRSRSRSWQDASNRVRLDAPLGADPSDFVRPHHAYVIDGHRGTGKTSVLLTLYPYLSNLRLCGAPEAYSHANNMIVADLASLELRVPEGVPPSGPAALTLPIVFTEDMELQETTMEAVFALMEHEIDVRLETLRDEVVRRRIEDLRRDLRETVGVAWTYSRKIGAEALPNDSLDYQDFVNRRADLSKNAYTKVTTWRRFVERYLDELGFQVLVLLFDDSDLNPSVAEDMIRAVRMYLSHPRVVSIVAVDMPTLNKTLFARSLNQHPIVFVPRGFQDYSAIQRTAADLVDQERKNVAELLEKVLPRPNRRRLAMSDLRHLDHFFKEAGQETTDPFGTYCRRKWEAATMVDQRAAWWLLSGPYRRVVAGDLRSIVSFRRLTDEDGISPLIALFAKHDLGDLYGRADGNLKNLGEMIASGDLGGDIGEAGVLEDEKERAFIDFWVDSQLAAGKFANSSTTWARNWLSISEPARQDERIELIDVGALLGVAHLLKKVPAPRNCLYVHQYRHLEVAFEESFPERSSLAEGWIRLSANPANGLEILREEGVELISMIYPDWKLSIDDARLMDVLSVAMNRAIQANVASGRLSFEDDDEGLMRIAARAIVALVLAASSEISDEASATDAMEKSFGALMDEDLDEQAKPAGPSPIRQILNEIVISERRRQEALFGWAAANELLAIGNDSSSLTRRRPPRTLTSTRAVPTPEDETEQLASLVSFGRPLCDQRDTRHVLLYAWSLLPLVAPLYEYGTDYLRKSDAKPNWQVVLEILQGATTSFDADGQAPDSEWLFADLGKPTVRKIVDDVRQGAASLEGYLESDDPAGSTDLQKAPRSDAAARIAWLLGASNSWAKRHLVVRA